MQIHEITKRQRTNEGLLDKVKSTISAAKTKYNDVKNKVVAVGDRYQEKQWDKTQDKRNKQAADAAKVLARKGFNVNTTTPAAQAQTPTRVKQQQQQKIAQLQQAFDQEFDIGYEITPNAAQIYAQQQAAKPPQSKLQQTIAAQNKQMSPQSGIREDNVTMSPGGIAIPAGAKTADRTSKKDIATEFPSWIKQKIPGLDKTSPEVQAKLNGIFSQMKTLKGKNPKAVDTAFQQYADLALSSVTSANQSQPGQQTQGGASASAASTRDGVARSLGLEPEALATLQQRIAQNKEQISNPNTGSKTIDTLIRAVAN